MQFISSVMMISWFFMNISAAPLVSQIRSDKFEAMANNVVQPKKVDFAGMLMGKSEDKNRISQIPSENQKIEKLEPRLLPLFPDFNVGDDFYYPETEDEKRILPDNPMPMYIRPFQRLPDVKIAAKGK